MPDLTWGYIMLAVASTLAGNLTGALDVSATAPNDFRRFVPRTQGDALAANQRVTPSVDRRHASLAQRGHARVRQLVEPEAPDDRISQGDVRSQQVDEAWAFIRSASKPFGPDLRIAVVAGGRSSEHAISLASARSDP